MISKNLEPIVKNRSVVVLMDLSWHLHRNYNALKVGVDVEGYMRPTGHLYGILNTVISIRKGYPDALIIMCKDGVPRERQELQAAVEGQDYKEGRPELEFDFYKDIPVLESALYMIPGVVFAYNEDKESDDLMYALAKQIEQVSSADIYIYSGDDDLLQAIDDRTCVVRKMDYKTNQFIKIDNFVLGTDRRFYMKFRGTDAKHIPFYRAIVGDKSDKIQGIPRFPRELAREIAMGCTEVEDIFKFIPVTIPGKRYMELLEENRERVVTNYKLMKLSADFNVNLMRRKVKEEVVKANLRKLKLNRFLRYIEEVKA